MDDGMSNVAIGFLIAWVALVVFVVTLVGHLYRVIIRVIAVNASVRFFQADGTRGTVTDLAKILDRFIREGRDKQRGNRAQV